MSAGAMIRCREADEWGVERRRNIRLVRVGCIVGLIVLQSEKSGVIVGQGSECQVLCGYLSGLERGGTLVEMS